MITRRSSATAVAGHAIDIATPQPRRHIMFIRKLFPLLFLAVAAEALAPERAAAQRGCVDCSICWLNGELGNKAPWGDFTSVGEVGLGSHRHCVASGGCVLQHPPFCGRRAGLDAVLVDIVAAVRGDDSQKLARAFADGNSFRDRIMYVPNRRAIQALGCNDGVIAHIPLREDSNALAWVMSSVDISTVVAPSSLQ